jgi:hypothetical protein
MASDQKKLAAVTSALGLRGMGCGATEPRVNADERMWFLEEAVLTHLSATGLLWASLLVGQEVLPLSILIANPYPVPTPPRWHPPPATGDADSGGEDWEVVSVPEVVEVIKAGEVASWKERAMVEPMHASPSAGHAKVVCAAEAVHAARAVHAAEAVASHATHHRVGRRHWSGKHRHHDSTSDCYFAERDNHYRRASSGCSP